MQFYDFHLMPWPHLPEDFASQYDSAWVTLSNGMYDPKKGEQLYQDYLTQLAYADELGFDGVCVNEHHQTAYGSMPSPNIMAAVLAEKTKRAKIAVLGNAIPLRDNPVRIAEEIAMLDLVSGGRVISGFVRGIGCEYHSFSKNPSESRERFHEAFDLIMQAWTKTGPFEFYGKYYKLRNVNPWVRPLQNPHPPIWIPSQGTNETLEWVAERRYTYLQTYSSIDTVRRTFHSFREATRRYGYEAPPEQMGWALPIYVGDTDEKAQKEAEKAVEYLFNDLFRMTTEIFFPAGYLSLQSMGKVLQARKGMGTSKQLFQHLLEKNYVLVGSPDTIVQQITEFQKEFGFGNLLPMLQFGNLPHELAMENIKMFADKVIPRLKNI